MPEREIDKILLYPLALSVLLHLAVFGLLLVRPTDEPASAPEPSMVELTDPPEAPPASRARVPESRRIAARTQRVNKEIAPKGDHDSDKAPSQPEPPVPPDRPRTQPGHPAQLSREGTSGRAVRHGEEPAPPGTSPRRGELARLRESYRKKYGAEVADGKTAFLNTEDREFGSFLRRFVTRVQEVWLYPQGARLRGIEGVTPVRITFKRGGSISDVELLESSGSRILDDEVLRSLKQLGPIGSFPKGYTGQSFNLIAFFQYGIDGERLH